MDRFSIPAAPRLTGPDVSEERARDLVQRWIEDTREVLQDAINTLGDEGQSRFKPTQLPSATVAQLQGGDARFRPGSFPRLVYVSDFVDGGTVAFSDGTNWLRLVTDLQPVTAA